MSTNAGGPFEARSYWEARLDSNPNLQGVGYLSLGKSFNGWIYRIRARIFDTVIRDLNIRPSTARVLDVGSGTGFYVERWISQGVKNLQGVDLTEAAVSRLSDTFPDVPFYIADIGSDDALGSLPLAEGTLDVVSCIDVLFHIVDDERYLSALSNMARLLVPGGHLVLSENCLHGNEIRLQHQVSRSLQFIEDALDASGLELVVRRPMLYLMNAPVDSSAKQLARWERWMLRLTRTELSGWLTGVLMYCFERYFVATKRESRTTEILVCRRRSDSDSDTTVGVNHADS